MTSLEGLTHYPPGYGVIAAKGEIDMGYRWKSGIITREPKNAGGWSSQWLIVNGDPTDRFPTGGAWKGVQVNVWKLEGLPIQEIDPFAWPPVKGATHWSI